MDYASLVNKISGYYNKGVYIQLIRSTTRWHFQERQHTHAWRCTCPENKPTKYAKNHKKLTKKTFEIAQKSYKFRKIILPFVLEKRVGKAFIYVEDLIKQL